MVDTHKMFVQSARMITAVAKKPQPIAPGMGPWFDYCEKVAPECKTLWKRLRQLDYEKDAENLAKWLKRLWKKEPPPDDINGLWFGLFNPSSKKREVTCQMYVGGSATFDPSSESNEWVCDLTWLPEGRYSSSDILGELYRDVEAITKNQVSYLGEPFVCHGYLALLISSWCYSSMRDLLLGNVPVRAIVIGHDSGDFYRIAVLDQRKKH
jgi:hypothetical protein